MIIYYRGHMEINKYYAFKKGGVIFGELGSNS